jgi:hypothetical protein
MRRVGGHCAHMILPHRAYFVLTFVGHVPPPPPHTHTQEFDVCLKQISNLVTLRIDKMLNEVKNALAVCE